MTQIFDDQGTAIPVTVLTVGPCMITQLKNIDNDGYQAVQMGYKQIRTQLLTKARIGHLKKSSAPAFKYLYEYKVNSLENLNIGQNITIDQLKIGNLIHISGTSIGKGFTGYQKRHHFSRGPMSHGSKNHRQPGSIGAGTTPGRVFPGKKMAGRMGGKKVTIKNLLIIDIHIEDNIILIKGSIPGKKGSVVSINKK